MLSIKNYFEPRDEGEDYFYSIGADQNKKYETLESIYNRIYSNKTLQEAKDISLYIRDKNQYVDKSLTYGEVTFRSMAYIFEYCKSRFDINEEGNFVDLGSGVGCAVIAAVLCSSFKKYIGVEFISALNDKANMNKTKFMDMFLDINKEYNDYLPEYIFDEELKNEIVFDVPKIEEEKNENEEQEEEKEEEEEEEENESTKIDEQDNLKNYIMSGKNDAQNVLDIIYGKNNNDNEEGFMSYTKKCQLRNKQFFEEYEKKRKLEKKDDENEKGENENPQKGRRKSIHDLIYGVNGEGGILQQLEKVEEKKSESDKSSKKPDKNKNKSNNTIKEENKDDKSSKTSQSQSEIKPKRTILPYIEFNCGNFLKMDLTEASFIFCNSTCFSSELFLLISKKISKEAQNGCIVVTFTKKLPFLNNKEWDIKKGFKRLMSWGLATVFVHRRIKSMRETQKTQSSKSSSKNDSLYSSKSSKSSHSSNTNSKSSSKSSSNS